MSDILEHGISFFTEDEWPFERMEGKPLVRTGFSGDNGEFICWFQAREEEQQVLFYSLCPVKVPEDKRQLVAEFITRANYGMVMGNFEMDYNDGEVRYKTSTDVEGLPEVTTQFIKSMIYSNVLMMDKYLPGIMQVIYSNVAPADAVREIEEA